MSRTILHVRRAPTLARRRAGWGLGAALTLLSWAASARAQTPATGAAEPEDTRGSQLFWLPENADAGRTAEELQEHLLSHRWTQAVARAQELIEGAAGDVLPEGFGDREDRRSVGPHHRGVAEWARAVVRELPPAGLAAYADRFGRDASRALAQARASGSAAALLRVAARYPAAPAAEQALWSAGDVEFAEGHLRAAERSWERAAELARRLDREPAELGRREEVRRAAVTAARAGRGLGPEDSSFRLPGPDEAPGPAPRAVSETWIAELPEHPFTERPGAAHANLVPLIHGDRVLLSTSLQLLCFDGYTGARQWICDPPAGWDALDGREREELRTALDHESQWIVPAAGSGVAVAALQIPFARLPNDDFQGFVITKALPDRRLFAFDLETGAPLWRHLPPPGWDGNSGRFVERMSVSGSPVVCGSLVLVPMSRMDGRIDLHLAAFELRTGELRWSTPVVSGQRELNMFNRHEREYSAPPVRVEGDTVLLLTQLGTVAALDLFTGAVRWQAVYEQIPLPQTQGLISLDRRLVWKNAPPVVAGGVVLCTPLDSEDLLAIDLADGRILWSQSRDALRPRRSSDHDVDVLLGADRDEVYLGGAWLASWRKPQGLDSRSPLVPGTLQLELGTDVAVSQSSLRRAPRPTLGSDEVLVPATRELLWVDRRDGQRISGAEQPWERTERGNVALGAGAVYVASNQTLRGFLDLRVLEARAAERLRADPNDTGAAIELARLLARSAEAEFDAGRASAALFQLAQARELLEPRREAEGGAVRPELVTLLELEAHIRRSTGQADLALQLFDQALALAEHPEQVLELRLQQLPMLRGRDDGGWRRALSDLEQRAGDLPLEASTLALDPDWLGFVRTATAALAPVRAATWVEVQRGLADQERGRFADALEVWHRLLASGAADELATGVTVGDRATERIALLLQLGGTQLYAPFEAAASRELERALATGDRGALAAVPVHFPFAAAARTARAAELERALVEGDVAAAARGVGALLAGLEGSDPTGEQRAVLEAELALALGRAGNLDFERGLLRRLARSHPQLPLPRGPAAGRPVAEVVAEFRTPEVSPAGAARFGPELARKRSLFGPWLLLGQPPLGAEAAGQDAPQPVLLAHDDRLEAFAADAPEDSLWAVALPFDSPPFERPERWVLTPTRAVVASGPVLVAFDLSGGRPVYSRGAVTGEFEALCAADGVVVALTVDRGERPPVHHLLGLDAEQGAELWRLTLPPSYSWSAPLCEQGHLVSISVESTSHNRAAVLDPFTGTLRAVLDLPSKLGARAERLASIEGDRLVLPSLLTSRVAALDLTRLQLAYEFDLGPERDLYAVLGHGSKLYLHATGQTLGRDGAPDALIEVDPVLGGRRTVYNFERGENLVGVRKGTRLELERPLVFAVSGPERAARVRVAAIDLTRGRRWIEELAVGEEQLYDVGWARAIVSDTTVALLYAQRQQVGGDRQRVLLDLFDTADGTRLGRRFVQDGYIDLQRIEPLAVGHTVWIGGEGSRGEPDRIDIWSDR